MPQRNASLIEAFAAAPELSPADFVQRTACPSCGSGRRSPLGGSLQNLVYGRVFPAGTYCYGKEMRTRRALQVCGECGLVYQEWIPSKDRISALYSSTKERRPWPADPDRLTWNRALGHIPGKKGRILDIGANDGHFLTLLPEGWQRAALEPTSAVHESLLLVTDEIYEGFIDDTSLGIPRESFDVITLFDTVEHLENVRNAMAHVAEFLKPGGTVLIETGNTACIPARLFKSAWWYYDYLEHMTFFDPGSLARACALKGLQVVECRPVIHTSQGSGYRMLRKLAGVMFSYWRMKKSCVPGRPCEEIHASHPLRVYWPDHLFAVAVKGGKDS